MQKIGFTLIELLVVISITAILVGTGLAAYSQFNRRQILDQITKTLKSDLRLTQSKALAGYKDCTAGICGGISAGCNNDSSEKSLDGWYVNFAGASYTRYGSCGGTQFDSKTVNLSSNVTISSSPNTVWFKPLSQGVADQTTITISVFGQSQTINVSLSGDIN